MAGRFSFSSPERRYTDKPWFRLGEFDVTTTVLVSAVCVLSMFVWAIDPSALRPLLLLPDEIRSGQIWRLVTWPLANAPDIWTVITIAIFWYFGRELEGMLGRTRFTTLLLMVTIVPALFATVLDLDLINSGGMSNLELGVFLIFIAEYPSARFFFGIPGWVIGAVVVAVQVLQLLGLRETDSVVFLLILIATAGLAARAVGMLGHYPWIPRIPLPAALTGVRRASGPTRSSRGRTRGSRHRGSRATGDPVIEGPWKPTPPPPRPGPDEALEQAELDSLLDKISASGLDSLTAAEKRRLNELSKRRR